MTKKNPIKTYLQDCKEINAKLPSEEEYYEKVRQAVSRHFGADLSTCAREFKDGTHVCLGCGFPLPYASGRCPNCGRELKTIDAAAVSENTKTLWVSVFIRRTGALGAWVIQRQFCVQAGVSAYGAQTASLYIGETYRNFINEDGKAISLRRGYTGFPYQHANPFRMDTAIDYRDKGQSGYYGTYAVIDWDEAVNERLFQNIKAKIHFN